MLSELTIATAINERYLLPLLVMLRSLQSALRPGCHAVLYLVHQRLSAGALEKIGSTVDTIPVAVNSQLEFALPPGSSLPPEAAFPLLLADLLPASLDRVLFLDADMLVMGDVAELFEQDLRGCVLGACVDPAVPTCGAPRGVKRRPQFGVPDIAPYFNAGVMLISLARWREKDVTRRAMDYLKEVGADLDFLHQEALNAVLCGRWLELDAKWNRTGALPYADGEADGAGIVHFSGRMKPWVIPIGGPYYQAYTAALSEVLAKWPELASGEPSLRDWLTSFYSRRLRHQCYPLERALWKRRLI